ncbi:hypothetical protein DZF91_27765 [Actinomadura logoneensis]|uniref:Uncharacterized protein n=1 Tax=Actinomadura logoneensis TaxID=2293572 RepID=A0A372JEI5_9ACTN|nr:hypothetical protein [Actinomadura logoneensis]RFU38425.1 hypothetical protein DZF91_27765 [Actinomadura logoneensis]
MDLTGFSLLYLPFAVAFVAFVIYGGVVMPAKEMRDSLRFDRPRGPNAVPDLSPDAGTAPGMGRATAPAASADAEVIGLRPVRSDRKAAA